MIAHLRFWLVRLWTLPTTAVGLAALCLALAGGGGARRVEGVLEVHGGLVTRLLRRLGVVAMTLGHVVIAVDARALDRTRGHERVHVRQCERWGPLFFPAYGAASLLAWLRGGRVYRDNAFEREAYATASAGEHAQTSTRDPGATGGRSGETSGDA